VDFGWTDEQLSYKKAVIEFAKKELDVDLTERDRNNVFDRDRWQRCADFGLLGLPVPEEYGGSEMDVVTSMLMMEGLGYGCKDNGLIFSINAQLWSVQMPIIGFGTVAQKEKYLPATVSGDLIGAHGMSEPGSGSDAYSLRCRADSIDGGYVLNGTKMFVTNGPVSDFAVVFATVDPSRGMWGVTAFLVDTGTPGYTMGREIDKMGMRTASMSELIFQDCEIPEENRLGPEGAGARIFHNSMAWERSCILGSNIGAMERQLEYAVQYANEREQFGQPIGKFQHVSRRLVDMKVRLETARLLLYKVAWLKQNGESTAMEEALAKLYLSESFVESSLDAIKVLGGYGYMTEFEVERDLRDAIGGTLYSGTSDIQRNIIARLLGL